MKPDQQHRLAAVLQGIPVPPKGAALVRQTEPRHDRIRSADLAPHGKPPRRDLVTTDHLARKKAAACSVRGSGGGESAPADGSKGSVRADLKAAFYR